MSTSFYKGLSYNLQIEQLFYFKPKFIFNIRENADQTLVPRFKLKNADIFDDFPSNTPTKFDSALILKAIKYGMIIEIDYKGEEDDKLQGHERTIYPVAFGKSSDGKLLLRGWHLKGWSVSKGTYTTKEWRLFRCDRILNMSFTGAFFRLAPDGYNNNGDKSIKTLYGIADFNEIRNLQQQLLNNNDIDTKNKTIIDKVNILELKNLNYNLKTFDPFANNVIAKKDAKNIRITFAKPVLGEGQVIAIIGISIEPNTKFKIKSEDKNLENYKSVKWVMADELKNMPAINNMVEYPLYLFIKSR